jgi:hypothetical protein
VGRRPIPQGRAAPLPATRGRRNAEAVGCGPRLDTARVLRPPRGSRPTLGQQIVSKMSVQRRRQYSLVQHNFAGQTLNASQSPRSQKPSVQIPKPRVAASVPAKVASPRPADRLPLRRLAPARLHPVRAVAGVHPRAAEWTARGVRAGRGRTDHARNLGYGVGPSMPDGVPGAPSGGRGAYWSASSRSWSICRRRSIRSMATSSAVRPAA